MNDLTTTTPAETFRANAAAALISAANMTLYELVDEFLRLTSVMDANVTKDEASGYRILNDAGELAERQRKLIVGTARARFGMGFEAYDRASSSLGSDF